MSITETAAALLQRLGEPISFSYETSEVRSPATGEITTPATVVTVNGYGAPSKYKSMDVDGDTIKQTDTRLVVNKISTKPEKGWSCTLDSTVFRVMDSQAVRKSGADVVYIVQLRV